jgi:hypothetical protein
MLAGADTPDQTACHGCSPVRATETSLAPIRDSELPSGLSLQKQRQANDRLQFLQIDGKDDQGHWAGLQKLTLMSPMKRHARTTLGPILPIHAVQKPPM